MANLDHFELEAFASDKEKVAESNTVTVTEKKKDSTTEVERVAQVLIDRGIDITQGYENWRKVGFALASELGEGGRGLFHDLSRMNGEYQETECDKQYSSYLKSRGSGITIASFFMLAKEAGVDLSAMAREHGHEERRSRRTTRPNGHSVLGEHPQDPNHDSYSIDNKIIIDNNKNQLESTSTNLGQGGRLAELSFLSVSVPAVEDTNTDFLPTFTDKVKKDAWCPFLQKIIDSQTSVSAQDAAVLASLFTLSSSMPNYYAIYDGHQVNTPGYLGVPAPAASGKGDIAVCKHLVDPIENGIRKAYEQAKEDYRKDMAAWQALSKPQQHETPAPEEPPYRSLFVSANSSTTAVCQAINDNKGYGLIFETEGVTMASTLSKEFGDYSDVLCKAFHHESISYTRRTDREHVYVDRPRLAVVVCLTPGQVKTLIPSYESGLGSRFVFYNLPRNLTWRNVFEQTDKTNDDLFTLLGYRYEPVYKALAARKGQPIQFLFSEAQKKEFNDFFTQLQSEQVGQLGDDMVAVVRRLGLIGNRLAMILSMLRKVNMDDQIITPVFEENEQALVCGDDDFHTAMTIINCLISHSAYVYDALVPHVDDEATQHVLQTLNGQKQTIFLALPNQFTTEDIIKEAEKYQMSDRTVRRFLVDLQNKHHLIKRIKLGHYEKIRHAVAQPSGGSVQDVPTSSAQVKAT